MFDGRSMLDQQVNVRIATAAWEASIHAYGTAYIFQRRAQGLRRRLQVLTFFGIVGPIFIGALVLSFGLKLAILSAAIPTALLVGIVQLVITVWSLVFGWQPAYAYATESEAANRRLALAFARLANDAAAEATDLSSGQKTEGSHLRFSFFGAGIFDHSSHGNPTMSRNPRGWSLQGAGLRITSSLTADRMASRAFAATQPAGRRCASWPVRPGRGRERRRGPS